MFEPLSTKYNFVSFFRNITKSFSTTLFWSSRGKFVVELVVCTLCTRWATFWWRCSPPTSEGTSDQMIVESVDSFCLCPQDGELHRHLNVSSACTIFVHRTNLTWFHPEYQDSVVIMSNCRNILLLPRQFFHM